MEIAGYIAAVLIGMSLGLIGGGGSILTVPVLVYLMHIHPVLATTYSLFVVGSCSLVGGTKAYLKGLVDFYTVLYFGLSCMLSVFLVRHFIVPVIPDHISTIGNTIITKDVFLMLLFAVLMLVAALSMIRSNGKKEKEPANKKTRVVRLLLQGTFVGIVTGLLGAGGGFLIVPALVLLSRLPMKTAIGSSLTIIAISALFGFFSTLSHYTIDWWQLLTFTAIAVLGIFIGSSLSNKISGAVLKKGFGWFVMVMGICILVKEIFFA
jgi:uncharacterized membrane protein YfcA